MWNKMVNTPEQILQQLPIVKRGYINVNEEFQKMLNLFSKEKNQKSIKFKGEKKIMVKKQQFVH